MENKELFEEITNELRSIKENIASEREALNAEKRALEQQKAEMAAPHAKDNAELRDFYNGLVENRAVSLNGTGSQKFVSELVFDVAKRHPLLESVKYFHGPNAQTNIAIFSPTIATPVKYAEGAKNIAEDTQAALAPISLTPEAYCSVLPVTQALLKLGYTNFESQISKIFSEAYADALYKAFIVGDGVVKGIFDAESVGKKTAIAGAAPTISELAQLALGVKDYGTSAHIFLNPAVYSALVAETGEEKDIYREELVRNKSIEGVPVVLTSYAPSTAASGAPIAVALDLANFGFAIADELTVEPLRKVGDLNVYYQSSMYFNGRVINKNNVWGLTIA